MSDIQYVYPLIHNKVTSPHYVTPTLRRARLIDWLNESAGCRAVVIAADAGYGKTTLLWQWEREVDFPCYWYKLDRNDRDWSLHISYLIESISQRHPGFGRRAHSMLEQLGGPGSSRPGVAAYLLAEMHERLTEPCTFIIDDWQFVASVTEVRGLWNQILRDAPPTCRFVFLSRAKPQLQFARFKTHGGYAEMRTDALRFNDREIEELFRDIYNDPLDPTELAELERRTEGWAASLQLVEVSLRERRTPEERTTFIQSITATTDSDLVEFLAEEVLDQQPKSVRDFLLDTSIVHRITPDLAARLTGQDDAGRTLTELEGRGLFTFRFGSQDPSFRYHGLFRDFLQRRLAIERADGEIAALHIHAASYFETNQSWPEAIHHYLKAGLQPQAARLIAKYGDDLATAGRLPILEEWLQKLPGKAVAGNARLSLLAGEIHGVRGEWNSAIAALSRARQFFARKNDRRMEAVACSKLSSVFNNLGDTSRAEQLATEGLDRVAQDDVRTLIRLRGNLAVTATWLQSHERAEHECLQVAVRAEAAGLEHYAAIAHHNLGVLLLYAGRLQESIRNLEKAATLWDASPTNPFADNSELVGALLLAGECTRAGDIAASAVRRTMPWVRANAEASFGVALVHAHCAKRSDAIAILRRLLIAHEDRLGPVGEKVVSLLVECLYLEGADTGELGRLLTQLETKRGDPRLSPITAVAAALAAHKLGRCQGHCKRAMGILARWQSSGSALIASLGRVPLALMGMEHSPRAGSTAAVEALTEAAKLGLLTYLSAWVERFASHAIAIAETEGGPRVLPSLIAASPDAWVDAAMHVMPKLVGNERVAILGAIEAAASPPIPDPIREATSSDIRELRQRLADRFAPPAYVQSFGSLALRTGGWDTAATVVTRRRSRLLLGLLVAAQDSALSRDQILDTLWPDADPGAALNSLNQSVFQLRRLFDSGYREGYSPQYVISTPDSLKLNQALVCSDLASLRSLAKDLSHTTAPQARSALGRQLLQLVRGEFLADLRYEDWAMTKQLSVHAEVRAVLLPIAEGDMPDLGDDLAARAARVLMQFDPYDEAAYAALVRSVARSGRRQQARTLLTEFAARVHNELNEPPSDRIRQVASMVGLDLGSVEVD